MNLPNYTLSIAPMMEVTDRHFRYFMRLLTKHALLYTPMITTQALLHGDKQRLLDFSPEEQPVAIQLGGDNPTHLADCAKLAEDQGYCEVNINIGCPSDRVKSGNFGACMMNQAELVAACVAAMKKAVDIPVTIKHRTGVDDQDSYENLHEFVSTVAQADCDRFIVHARKAWLSGLSPKQNRTIPPLRYDYVYQLKKDFPQNCFVINGGIRTVQDSQQHLQKVDGVMLGRVAYEEPYLLNDADKIIFNKNEKNLSRTEIVEAIIPYTEQVIKNGQPLTRISNHLLPLFKGQVGAKKWRRYLSENSHKPDSTAKQLIDAMLISQTSNS